MDGMIFRKLKFSSKPTFGLSMISLSPETMQKPLPGKWKNICSTILSLCRTCTSSLTKHLYSSQIQPDTRFQKKCRPLLHGSLSKVTSQEVMQAILFYRISHNHDPITL